jgi:hypothetical protein
MPQYKDEEIAEKLFSLFYRNLPLVIFILGVKILDAYMAWPLAIAIAGILGYGLLGYWIPEKPKQAFPKYFTLIVLFSVAISALAYLTIWLGWIEER